MEGAGELLVGMALLLNAIVAAISYIHVRRTAKVMVELEHNTNSMKDALVKVVGEAEHAKGILQGKRDAERKVD